MDMPPNPKQNRNETVARALQLLMLYSTKKEMGLREMSRQLNLSSAVTHRLASTLCDYRFLQQLPESRKYMLGSACLKLAECFRDQDQFTQICITQMNRLRDQTNETVALHVYRAGLRVCVLESPSPQPIRHVMRPGSSFPITFGASDVIIRSSVNKEEIAEIEEQLRASGAPQRKPTEEEFDAFKRRGWSTSDGARSPGAVAVAAPVRHPDALYILSLIGPRDRMLTTGVENLAPLVLATAEEMRISLAPLRASL